MEPLHSRRRPLGAPSQRGCCLVPSRRTSTPPGAVISVQVRHLRHRWYVRAAAQVAGGPNRTQRRLCRRPQWHIRRPRRGRVRPRHAPSTVLTASDPQEASSPAHRPHLRNIRNLARTAAAGFDHFTGRQPTTTSSGRSSLVLAGTHDHPVERSSSRSMRGQRSCLSPPISHRSGVDRIVTGPAPHTDQRLSCCGSTPEMGQRTSQPGVRQSGNRPARRSDTFRLRFHRRRRVAIASLRFT